MYIKTDAIGVKTLILKVSGQEDIIVINQLITIISHWRLLRSAQALGGTAYIYKFMLLYK